MRNRVAGISHMQEGASKKNRIAGHSKKKERTLRNNRVIGHSEKKKGMKYINKDMSKVSFFN